LGCFLPPGQWGLAGNHFKVFVETREIIESALEAELLYIEVIFDQQPAGVPHAELEKETGVGFAGAGFEPSAEGIGTDVSNGGDLFQLDGAMEMAVAVFIDMVDAEMFGIGGALVEADRGEGLQLGGSSQDMQGLHQEDDAGHAFGVEELFEEWRHFLVCGAPDLQTPAGIFEKGLESDIFRKIEEGTPPEIRREVDDMDIYSGGLGAAGTNIGEGAVGCVEAGAVRCVEAGAVRCVEADAVRCVEADAMRKVGAKQNHIAGAESCPAVTDELVTLTLFEVDKLHFRMEMPTVVYIGNPITPDGKGVTGFFGYFQELRFHG
jgi:hypothetical protein